MQFQDGSEYQGMSISIRNELERMRRNEQSHLLNKLAHLVFPEHQTERRSVLSVLQSVSNIFFKCNIYAQ